MPRKKKTEEQAASEKAALEIPKLSRSVQLVKGMKDILPSEQGEWEYARSVIQKIMRDYSFDRIDVPVVEDIALYTHGVGKQTDIVEKEMYTLVDLGGNTLALRPEFTAGIARAFVEHGMTQMPQPIKLYTLGPLFRYDKPQEGRYRQHHQFNCEIIGEGKPAADVQLILLAHKFLQSFELPVVLHINSIGCLQCRTPYKTVLSDFYKGKRNQVCEDCKRRLIKNPLRLLDCKAEQCQPIKAKAPQIVDSLCDECREHFMGVLDFIDDLDIPYRHNPCLVRGFDYYTRTVFEYVLAHEEEGEEKTSLALLGGGRYDNLIEMFGGPSTPACGFGAGLERIILFVREYEKRSGRQVAPDLPQRDVFVAQLGEQAKKSAMRLYEDLLFHGFSLAESFTKDSLKSQLEIANRLKCKFTLILGQKELLEGTIIIRNMEGGEQEVIDSKKLIPLLKKKIEIEQSETPVPSTPLT